MHDICNQEESHLEFHARLPGQRSCCGSLQADLRRRRSGLDDRTDQPRLTAKGCYPDPYRFGVVQSSVGEGGSRVKKIRPINDFIQSLANLTTSSRETIAPDGVDALLASLLHRIRLSRKMGRWANLKLQTIDLRKAYKNYPCLLDSYICVHNPTALQLEDPRSSKPLSCLLARVRLFRDSAVRLQHFGSLAPHCSFCVGQCFLMISFSLATTRNVLT